MYKLGLIILAPKVKNNRKAHEYYLKHTMEQATILKEVVEQAKSQNPLDSASYSAYMYVKLIQELLGYVRDTCPDIHKPRVNSSTSASESKPSGNTKNDRIHQTPSGNEKNKVEVQSRKVKSSLNKRNSESKNVCNEHVKHPIKGAKALCSECNKCLFDANHDVCLIDHEFSMNVRAKSASKKNEKRKEWKPTKKCLTMLDINGNPPAYACCKYKWEKYILIIVDDYSRFTWVNFLASKDEALDFIIKFLKMIQVILNETVRNIHTDNGTDFVNQTLRDYYKQVGISHETSVAKTPKQNGVVERQNLTLVEAARTMLIFAQAPLFLWAEAIATACYT
nr:putative ribonuclease H-like domain-containing protein [Tanacetum cinerariifolium]